MLQRVTLTNYRNFAQLQLELARGNIVIAPNGSGKSNFVEAIYYSNFGHSFRTIPTLVEQINDHSSTARVELTWQNAPQVAFSLSRDPAVRKFEVGEKRVQLAKVVGRHNIVLFAPSSVNLIGEDPALRRNDLDDYLSVIDSTYQKSLLEYRASIRSRNVLLRLANEGKSVKTELAFFTNKVAELGAQLVTVRSEFITQVKSKVAEVAKVIFTEVGFDVAYTPLIDPQNYYVEIMQKFEQNKNKEIVAGKTLYGLHRDDLLFTYQGSDLRYRGSRGQQRLASLIYKIAQLEHGAMSKPGDQLMLLDDLMSELDEKHRQSCAEYLVSGDYQYLLTSAEEKDVPQILLTHQVASLHKIF